jgi:phage terminase small subunit
VTDKLNARQTAFVNAYTSGPTLGNATQSARKAGYTGSDEVLAVTGHDLLRNPKVSGELQKRAAKAVRKSTLDAAEKRELLAQFARDGEAPLRDRIKSIEVHAKMDGDFIEKREISGPGGGPVELGYSKDVARAELERRIRERYGDKADEMLALVLGGG